MRIIDIYNTYHLPERLRIHMLKVGACCKLILDNFDDTPINKKAIITVALLHDTGNMAKIGNIGNTNIDDITLEDKEFINIRKKYIDKYGLDDNLITIEIGKELGLTDYELKLFELKESKRNEEIMKSNNFEEKICAYCDERVSPYGVMGIKDRLEDAKKRYKGSKSIWGNEEEANHLIECALEIEKQIMKHCKIKPEDINDNSIEKYIEELKEFEI